MNSFEFGNQFTTSFGMVFQSFNQILMYKNASVQRTNHLQTRHFNFQVPLLAMRTDIPQDVITRERCSQRSKYMRRLFRKAPIRQVAGDFKLVD